MIAVYVSRCSTDKLLREGPSTAGNSTMWSMSPGYSLRQKSASILLYPKLITHAPQVAHYDLGGVAGHLCGVMSWQVPVVLDCWKVLKWVICRAILLAVEYNLLKKI
jgi:hypothetical protein